MLSSPRFPFSTTTCSVASVAVLKVLSPLTFSMDESGYGTGGTQLPNQPDQQFALATLDVAMMRINLGYVTPGDPNSGIVCKAAGASASITGDQWIAAIIAAGAIPQIRVQMNSAQSQSTWAADAANMVNYFNKTAGHTPVNRWIIGNEPDANGLSVATYSAGFIAMRTAMRAVDSTIKIGGPVCSYYNANFLTTFMSNLAAQGVTPDYIIWHSYGTGTTTNLADAPLLAITKQKYFDEPNTIRTMLVNQWGATVGGQIPIELGEWNSNSQANVRQLQHYDSVWTALALSHMVRAGIIERCYTDKNGLMGTVCDVANPTLDGVTYTAQPNDPMPKYHGIGMFTGEGLFPGFGSNVVAVSTTSGTGLVEAAASNNPRNIVAINYSPTDTASTTFNLTGVSSASVAVWQKNSGNQEVVNLGAVTASGGTFSYALNPYTATTFVVTPTNSPPTPTGLAATPGNAQVALAWTASSGATSYNVKRATTSGGPYSTVGTPATNSFTNTGLTNGTTYYYVVSAVNGGGESLNSTQVSAAPVAPVGGTITFEGESLTFGASSGQTWRTSTDANGSGGAIAFFDSVATGNYVTLVTPSVTAGTYEVRVVTKTANNRGSYQLAIAPSVGGTYTNWGTPKDQYSASQVYGVEQVVATVTFGSTSTKAFRFTITGKNAASSGYGLAIDAIKLIPQ